jgi:hypothetical protein
MKDSARWKTFEPWTTGWAWYIPEKVYYAMSPANKDLVDNLQQAFRMQYDVSGQPIPGTVQDDMDSPDTESVSKEAMDQSPEIEELEQPIIADDEDEPERGDTIILPRPSLKVETQTRRSRKRANTGDRAETTKKSRQGGPYPEYRLEGSERVRKHES